MPVKVIIMKMKLKLNYILALSVVLCSCVLFGHDVPVHKKITDNAAASAYTYLPPIPVFLILFL